MLVSYVHTSLQSLPEGMIICWEVSPLVEGCDSLEVPFGEEYITQVMQHFSIIHK